MSVTRKVEFKSSMKVMDIASVKRTKELLGDKDRVHLGFVHGYASDKVKRTAPDGSAVFWGLAGAFEMIPGDPDMPILRSSICYLSPDAMETVIGMLKDQAGPDGKGQVTGACFIYDVFALKGGQWELGPIIKAFTLDPLEETRKKLADARPPRPVAAKAKA